MNDLRKLAKSKGGRIAFLPWLTLPTAVNVGAFRFQPVKLAEIDAVVGDVMAEAVATTIRTHVDQSGKPIESCTLILMPKRAVPWDMPDQRWPFAAGACKLLALGALAEQRFLCSPVFHGHMNSTMFRPANHIALADSPCFSTLHNRRGGSLRVGGRMVTDTVFQQPYQIEGTRCDAVNARLIRAVIKAEKEAPELFSAIETALDMFLLGHSEAPELDDHTCVMLSAMALERLLEPKKSTAQGVAEEFTELFSVFPHRSIASSTWMQCDPKFQADQATWPLHRKWMKELYEARSSQAHRGPKPEFSSNFEPEKHLVIAAFVFPLVMKLKLANAGLYILSSDEIASCEVLDELIDSDWGTGFENPPQWPRILDQAQANRSLRTVIMKTMRKAGILDE
jgi:hypothetical protein